ASPEAARRAFERAAQSLARDAEYQACCRQLRIVPARATLARRRAPTARDSAPAVQRYQNLKPRPRVLSSRLARASNAGRQDRPAFRAAHPAVSADLPRRAT